LFDLLIFDLDGTLVDSKKDISTAVNLMLEELGFPKRDPELIYGFIGGGVHKLVLSSMPEGRADMLDRGVDIFWALYKEHVLDTTTTFPGVYKMLEVLSPVRRMAIATNKPYSHTHMILQGLDIDRYFASIQGWKMGIPVKPDPELVVRALAESGVDSGRAVMIGDGSNDVLAARAAGVRTCAVGYGYGNKERLMELTPDFFAESVGDIVKLFK
jgi:phosphoglycolate phosphatase